MKNFGVLSIVFVALITIFACKTMPVVEDALKENPAKVIDNTFQATIVNNSPFTVEIDGKTIKTDGTIKNSFPLMEGALYDGWFVNYTIPLSNDVFYLHKEKVQVTNNQATIVIEPPTDNSMREAYIVVKNTSKQSIELTDGAYGLLSACLNGRINTYTAQREYNIAPSKVAVYEIATEEDMEKGRVFAFQKDKHYSLLENTVLKHGYVYVFEFTGKEVIKIDERPILKVNEPLWKIDDSSLAIEKVLSKDGLFYAVGKKRLIDSDGNAYYCPYIRCMNSLGYLKWETEKSSIDGEASDAVLLENGSLLACGQSVIADRNVGSLWLYSSDGSLLSNKNYDSLQELINLAVVDGGIVIAGFDNEGEFSLSKITIVKNAIAGDKKIVASLPETIAKHEYAVCSLYEEISKTLYLFCNLANEDGEVAPSKLFAIKENGKTEEIKLDDKIASISSATRGASGAIYIGGESTIDEKTVAVVLKIEKDRTVKVFYQGSAPFSYITSMYLDEMSKALVAGGVCKAKESSGLGGVPFIASFDLASGSELWRLEYKNIGKQLLRSFVPCVDYGFVASFSSAIQEGEFVFYGASILTRMNATGEVK